MDNEKTAKNINRKRKKSYNFFYINTVVEHNLFLNIFLIAAIKKEEISETQIFMEMFIT